MDHVFLFKELFEYIPVYRKIVLLVFSIKNDVDLLNECGFLNNDINRLSLEGKNILLEQNEEFLYFIENEEESILGKILNK